MHCALCKSPTEYHRITQLQLHRALPASCPAMQCYQRLNGLKTELLQALLRFWLPVPSRV